MNVNVTIMLGADDELRVPAARLATAVRKAVGGTADDAITVMITQSVSLMPAPPIPPPVVEPHKGGDS